MYVNIQTWYCTVYVFTFDLALEQYCAGWPGDLGGLWVWAYPAWVDSKALRWENLPLEVVVLLCAVGAWAGNPSLTKFYFLRWVCHGLKYLLKSCYPKLLGRLGKENPSKKRCKVAFVQRKCAVMSSVSVRFLYASYNFQAKIVYACRAAGSTVRYVYAFWNYLSDFLRQSCTPPSATWSHTTLQSAFWEPSRLRT